MKKLKIFLALLAIAVLFYGITQTETYRNSTKIAQQNSQISNELNVPNS